MAEDDFQEKTEQATERKKEKAREKGQVLKSQDINSTAAMAGIVMIFLISGEYFFSKLSDMTASLLRPEYGSNPIEMLRSASLQMANILAPFLLTSAGLALTANVMQVGFVSKPLSIELEKVSPISGLKRIFSTKGLVEFIKALLKFMVVGGVFYYIVKKNLDVLPLLSAMEINVLIGRAGSMLLEGLVTAFLCFVVIAFVTYALDKWQHDKSQRMSLQDIKEEQKESDGDPLIKARIKTLQREASRKRMMQEVPKATVVVTNPTHLAVALKYDSKKMSTPKVVAKGSGLVAARIKEIAKEHNVSIVEDKLLARALFKLELNAFIPEELYVAVAKILAYIYKLRGTL
jgi:flagellar biosynthetic protein FlhB